MDKALIKRIDLEIEKARQALARDTIRLIGIQELTA